MDAVEPYGCVGWFFIGMAAGVALCELLYVALEKDGRGEGEMIDLKISIGFSITNLTGFQWHELQDEAQKLANEYALHTVPTTFFIDGFRLVTVGDADLYVSIRRSGDKLEFIFIDFNADWPCRSSVEVGE